MFNARSEEAFCMLLPSVGMDLLSFEGVFADIESGPDDKASAVVPTTGDWIRR